LGARAAEDVRLKTSLISTYVALLSWLLSVC
jgi:hypothetical protein